jgi:salicylate hydroxylase
MWVLSRYKLQETLEAFATSLDIPIRWGCPIEKVDTSRPAVILSDRSVLDADIVIGADGISSIVRSAITTMPHNPSPMIGFHLDIPERLLKADPDLAPLVEESNFFLGPGQTVVAINMPDKDNVYNVFLGSMETSDEKGDWFEHADRNLIKKKFADFEPRIQKLVDLSDPEHCYIWHLRDMPVLPTWVSDEGSTVIIGDAAHAVLPYAGQVSFSC